MAPLTPDFADYEWSAISRAELLNGFVVVGWPDGAELACYSLWLAENCEGLGLDPTTRESMIDPADLPRPEDLTSAEVGADGRLVLHWQLEAGPKQTSVHPGWLRHVADGQHHPQYRFPPQEPWTAASLVEPPSLDGSTILDDDRVLLNWLILLVRYGLARLQHCPTSESFVAELTRRIGPIRGSNFGEVFTVRARHEADSTAYTGLRLGQHTDLPTRETPPGFQFLHCTENSVAGGWSRMTDGLTVVAELREHYPADYEALTTLNWGFLNRSPTEEHRWCGPIIDHVQGSMPLTLRAFYPVRAFPHMDQSDIPRAYAAMRRFSAVAHDDRFQLSYPFEPGDMVGFDNRRVLHGRDAFEPGAGTRILQGCYLDHDDLYSRFRVLVRRHGTRPAP